MSCPEFPHRTSNCFFLFFCFLRDTIIFETFKSGDGYSAHVDMYNASSNSWSSYPTGLGEARGDVAAASLPSGLVFFAGGQLSGAVDGVCNYFFLNAYQARGFLRV
jgi:hypothetical protein